ncbi:MAG: flagellar biosynthesis protein FlgF, partial [Pseudomonadota bacterium]
IEVSRAGIVSIQPMGEVPAAEAEPVQLKLVRPNVKDLEKGEDGLFRFRDPNAPVAPFNPDVTLANGFIEGSNVNAVSELTSLIALNRQYEMQVKLMKRVDENTAATTQILSNQ